MQETLVGLDVHKKTIRISMLDAGGIEIVNAGISNTEKTALGGLPKDVRFRVVVSESRVLSACFI